MILSVARSGGVAAAKAPNEFEFVYHVATQQSTPVVERALLQGTSFKASTPLSHPFGEEDRPSGSLVTANAIRAYGAPNPTNQVTEVIIDDNASDAFDEKGKLTLTYAPYLALAAWGSKLAAGVPVVMADTSRGAEIQAVELVNGVVSPIASGTLAGGSVAGTVPDQALNDSALAFAALDTSLIVLQGAPDKLAFYRFAGEAPIELVPIDTASFVGNALGASLDSFDGARVAIAAARNRIVIVWLDSSNPADVSGHFAVLGCQDIGK